MTSDKTLNYNEVSIFNFRYLYICFFKLTFFYLSSILLLYLFAGFVMLISCAYISVHWLANIEFFS